LGLDVHTAAPGQVQPRRPSGARDKERGLRQRLARLDVKVSPYLFVSPYFIIFAIFGLFPLVFTLWMSLHKWELAGGVNTYTGLRNYRMIFADSDFWNSVYNTVGMFVLATVPQLIGALLLANVLNRRMRANTFFRMGMLMPLVVSTAAVAVVFSQLFSVKYGLVNWGLGKIGIGQVQWNIQQYPSWIAVSTMVDWRWLGYNALIYLAAMQAIPKDLYEAAAIDGASRRRQFWQITVPLLRPTIIFTSIISTIGGMQLFTEPVLFGNSTQGGDTHQFQTVAMYMYAKAFEGDEYGYGAAVAWLLFLIIVIFSLVNFLVIRRMGGEKE
jgi:cellobiose transport system permease protein